MTLRQRSPIHIQQQAADAMSTNKVGFILPRRLSTTRDTRMVPTLLPIMAQKPM